MVVGTDIEPANIISPDDQYVWFPSHAVLPLNWNFFFDFNNGSNCTPFPLLAMCEEFLFWNNLA
jgi:hypothetical protein